MALAAFGTDRVLPQRPRRTRSSCSTTARSRFASDRRGDGLPLLRAHGGVLPATRAGRAAHPGPLRPRVELPGSSPRRSSCTSRSALHERTGQRRLAIAGGVASELRREREDPRARRRSRSSTSCPTPATAGSPLGAALYGYHVVLGGTERHPPAPRLPRARRRPTTRSSPRSTPAEDIEFQQERRHRGASAPRSSPTERIIGWVQGGAEFGPRALGHRSILADPRTRREQGAARQRDQAAGVVPTRTRPSVLAEHADEYFEMLGPSPYMLLAVNTRDGGARQGSRRSSTSTAAPASRPSSATIEPLYHRLISKFHEITGVPLVLNTSFNGYGEPMVETADRTPWTRCTTMGLDALAVGDYLAWKWTAPHRFSIEAGLPAAQRATANSRQRPGTPLSSCSPRSWNSMSDPATRSLTVLDTSTSPG